MRGLIPVAFVALIIQPSIARAQEFAKLVITPSATGERTSGALRILSNGHIAGHSIPVVELVSLAYDVPVNPSPRLSSLPEWTAERRFDIEAKALTSFQSSSDNAEKQAQQVQQVVRRLLADGFGLVLKARNERTPVYALVAKKTGVKLTTAHANDCIFDTSPEGCHSFAPGFGHPLDARAVSMSDLAQYLENWTDLPVVNRTAVSGLYQMHSQGWKPMILPPPPPGVAASGDEFANLPSLSAVLEKLGLELRREDESVSLYTVEHIREPGVR